MKSAQFFTFRKFISNADGLIFDVTGRNMERTIELSEKKRNETKNVLWFNRIAVKILVKTNSSRRRSGTLIYYAEGNSRAPHTRFFSFSKHRKMVEARK